MMTTENFELGNIEEHMRQHMYSDQFGKVNGHHVMSGVFNIYTEDKEAAFFLVDGHDVKAIKSTHDVSESGRFSVAAHIQGILIEGDVEAIQARAKSLLMRDHLLVNVNNHDNLVHQVETMLDQKQEMAAIRP